MTPEHGLLLTGGTIITGDGTTFLERGSVRIRGALIVDVTTSECKPEHDETVINVQGCTILPGIINAHAHGCIHGPSMPSGSMPFEACDVSYQRNRHLLSGTTTLLNVCGLAMADEVDDQGSSHPLDIHIATAHTPASIGAALAVDGKGLTERHRHATVDTLIAAGAKALGEAGGGQTLGGGAQDYRFIPAAIEAQTGTLVHPATARALKEAVLGRYLDGTGASDDTALEVLLDRHGLGTHLHPADLRNLIWDTVMRPVALSLAGLEEIAAASARLGMPAVFHNAAPTANTLIRLAERYPRARIIAGHSNHPSFSPDEAVEHAKALRAMGVTIDVSTLDVVQTRWRNTPENLDALVEAGLVDTVSTDFAGGDWDSILAALQRMITMKQLAPSAAVALATGNVARTFPELAGDRGLIESGKRADIAIVESHNLGRVRHVIIAGRPAVFNGTLVQGREKTSFTAP